MKYGLDYDGTITDINNSKSLWIKENLGMNVAPWKTDRTCCVPLIGLENYIIMGENVYNREATLSAKEIPGALSGLECLSKKGELYLVTMRNGPKLDFAKEWLNLNGVLKYFSGFGIVKDSYGKNKTKEQMCTDFDIGALVDDDERHLTGIKIPGFRKVLFKYSSTENYALQEDILLARNWQEVLKVI